MTIHGLLPATFTQPTITCFGGIVSPHKFTAFQYTLYVSRVFHDCVILLTFRCHEG